jgi:AraC-like DNA-binding protein
MKYPDQITTIRPRTSAITTASTSLARDVSALGWLSTHARSDREHLVLPTDLFMLTVHSIGEGAGPTPAVDAGELSISITLLRTQARRFRSQSDGTLSFALLTAAGLMRVLRAPLKGVTDSRVALSRFFGSAEERALRDTLLDSRSADERMVRFARWIENRIHERYAFNAQQSRVAATAAWLQEHHGPLDLDGLRMRLAVSQRQLERDFRTWLGVSPATYARLVRFQRAARAVVNGHPLVDAAIEFDFCDQPHLNRGFRALTTLTPSELIVLANQPVRRQEQKALAGRIFLVDAPSREALEPEALLVE